MLHLPVPRLQYLLFPRPRVRPRRSRWRAVSLPMGIGATGDSRPVPRPPQRADGNSLGKRRTFASHLFRSGGNILPSASKA